MKKHSRSLGARLVQAKRSFFAKNIALPVDDFIQNETISGAILLLAALVALFWANLPVSSSYFEMQKIPIVFQVGSFVISENFKYWINDGFMALFFFVVALEIKREFVLGELSKLSQAILPIVGALGGMILPAVIYLALNWQTDGMRGWGIPMPTDIAFAMAIISLLSKRIPQALRILLLAYAIVDSVGAILVIAFFYTKTISWLAIGVALFFLLIILGLLKMGVRSGLTYVLLGLFFWGAILKSGVHAIISGVILGFFTPAKPFFRISKSKQGIKKQLPQLDQALRHHDEGKKDLILGRIEELTKETESPLERLERLFHPPVSYVILPLFALLNAGIKLSTDLIIQAFSSTITWGILLAFIVGKTVGISSAMGITVHFKIAKLPKHVNWNHALGISLLGGIGFTVSLFITHLAFSEETLLQQAKIGILVASLISAIIGFSLIRWRKNK
ncbi:MAG: Na+/H+ antiporter NhaA [Verrucomicrobiae bacterium]|nr:Na+/H+ antiporter NhaA [Verrucomicrobiae bacterium]